MAANVAQMLRTLRDRAKISRRDLAVLAGYTHGSGIQYYEDEDTWAGRKFPVDFVASIAPHLVGKGTPPIVEKELWELADMSAGLIVSKSPVIAVPIVDWPALLKGAKIMEAAALHGMLDVVGLKQPGRYVTVIMLDNSAERIAPAGGFIVIDLDDQELRDGGHFIIVDKGAPVLRLYRANPPRFESEAMPPAPAIYHTAPVEVIGRLDTVITKVRK